jgi:four helix bundle protein
MSTIKRFEDLRVWQDARDLVRIIYKESGNNEFGRDFGLRDQIRRAAVSVMSNIAEGFGAGSDAELVRFLGIARRSNSEVRSQAYIALDLGYLSQDRFQVLSEETSLIERQINSFISYLSKSRHHSIKETTTEYSIDLPEGDADS